MKNLSIFITANILIVFTISVKLNTLQLPSLHSITDMPFIINCDTLQQCDQQQNLYQIIDKMGYILLKKNKHPSFLHQLFDFFSETKTSMPVIIKIVGHDQFIYAKANKQNTSRQLIFELQRKGNQKFQEFQQYLKQFTIIFPSKVTKHNVCLYMYQKNVSDQYPLGKEINFQHIPEGHYHDVILYNNSFHSMLFLKPKYHMKVQLLRYTGHPYIKSYMCHQNDIYGCISFGLKNDLTISQYLQEYPEYYTYLKQRVEAQTYEQKQQIEVKYSNVPEFPAYSVDLQEQWNLDYCDTCYALFHIYCQSQCLLSVAASTQIHPISYISNKSSYIITNYKQKSYLSNTSHRFLVRDIHLGYNSRSKQSKYGFGFQQRLASEINQNKQNNTIQIMVPDEMHLHMVSQLPIPFQKNRVYQFSLQPHIYTIFINSNTKMNLSMNCQNKVNITLQQINQIISLRMFPDQALICKMSIDTYFNNFSNGVIQFSKSYIVSMYEGISYGLFINHYIQTPLHIPLQNKFKSFKKLIIKLKRCLNKGKMLLHIYPHLRAFEKITLQVNETDWQYQIIQTDRQKNSLIIEIEVDTYEYVQIQYRTFSQQQIISEKANKNNKSKTIQISQYQKVYDKSNLNKLTVKYKSLVNHTTVGIVSLIIIKNHAQKDYLRAKKQCPHTSFLLFKGKSINSDIEQFTVITKQSLNLLQNQQYSIEGLFQGQAQEFAIIIQSTDLKQIIMTSQTINISEYNNWFSGQNITLLSLLVLCLVSALSLIVIVLKLFKEKPLTSKTKNQ